MTAAENGLGKVLRLWVQIQPATLLKITRRPMKTTTTASSDLLAIGRMIARSMTTPMTKAIATVAANAPQYGNPLSISDHAI